MRDPLNPFHGSMSSLCYSHRSSLSSGCYLLAQHWRDLQREERRSVGGARAGDWGGGGGVGKGTELPDLNKVNFPAIWPVFGIEGEALKAGGA